MLSALFIFAALALVFVPLEHIAPIRRVAPDWRRLATDACHVLFSGAMIRGGIALIVAAVAVFARPLTPAAFVAAVRAQPGWLQFLEIFLVSDFVFYWTHRMTHRLPLLWRLHEVHHSSEKLDWIAGNRIHPLDWIFSGGLIAASTALLGFQPGPLLAYALIYEAHATLLHSNVRMNFGPLRWVFTTPQYHHWHHANHPDAWDRNFGGQLIIFDMLFGTLNLPADGRMPQTYGLSQPPPRDYLGQLLHPFGLAPTRNPSGAGLGDVALEP
jgi:sterol desaturase/sphingolipid hydroxylase (fatty acid hydroxylase superfamily)